MNGADSIQVELVFALEKKQSLKSLPLAKGTTARSALLNSPLVDEFPGTDFALCPVGVWGKPVSDDYVLQEGDRLEAYRPLRHDPREFRRELASKGRSMGVRPTRD